MSLPILRPPTVQDHDDLYQRSASAFMKQVADIPGIVKNTVTAILGTSTVRVPHGLGRAPIAWQIIDKNAQADVWRTASSNADTIPLQASATVTVTIQFW